ncbi:MAG: F0F1 ATP synthase subunit delta, partial [Salinivirgaceae bacterium]|nr:F0F1 ATP synthase subunit delta [Salinivirgaceae bacterium]
SAVELNEKQIEILNKSISNQLNKEPVIETVVDKTLLGGYQLILGNKQLDHSVKRMLKDFNKLI